MQKETNYDGREMIVNAFKNKMCPIVPDDFSHYDGDVPSRSRSSSTSTTDKSDFTADDIDKIYIGDIDGVDEFLFDTEKYLDLDLIGKYFFNKSLKKYLNF